MRRRFWRSDTAPFLEKQERILNEMAELVTIFVVFSQVLSFFPWQNDRYHALINSLEYDCVCIISPVCQKIFRLESLNQLR